MGDSAPASSPETIVEKLDLEKLADVMLMARQGRLCAHLAAKRTWEAFLAGIERLKLELPAGMSVAGVRGMAGPTGNRNTPQKGAMQVLGTDYSVRLDEPTVLCCSHTDTGGEYYRSVEEALRAIAAELGRLVADDEMKTTGAKEDLS